MNKSAIIREISKLSKTAIHGTYSEIWKKCSKPGCACRNGGVKHGPNCQVSYRALDGKTSAYYVPIDARPAIQRGVAAWERIQVLLRELSVLNKESIIPYRHKAAATLK